MRAALVLVVAAACGGTSTPATSREPPGVRLVRCAPASPPPQLEVLEPNPDHEDEPPPARKRQPGWGSPSAKRGQGSVTLGTVTVTGGLAADRIVEALRPRLAELVACYDRSPPVRAAVQWRLSIGANGRVIFANTSAPVIAGELATCITRALTATVFPTDASTTAAVVPLVFEPAGAVARREESDLSQTAAWTPFAIELGGPPATAAVVGRATEAALRRRLPAIAACFGSSTATGSLRLMLRVNANGDLAGLRVGGMGDAASERCVARELAKLTVVTPASSLVEVACDLSRGDARPWRVAPAGGYDVIEASKTQLRHGEMTVAVAAEPPAPLPDAATYLVLAQPDTPGVLLQHAFVWASAGLALLAVRDGKAPPLYLGIGSTGNAELDDLEEGDVVRPVLHVGARTLTVCVNRATQHAKLRDVRAVGTLVQRVAAKCRSLRCAQTLQIAIDRDARARDLVEVVGAVRSAGFERVLLGGDGCVAAAND
jgi:hypothetical protein